jgi:hypothetical protein
MPGMRGQSASNRLQQSSTFWLRLALNGNAFKIKCVMETARLVRFNFPVLDLLQSRFVFRRFGFDNMEFLEAPPFLNEAVNSLSKEIKSWEQVSLDAPNVLV